MADWEYTTSDALTAQEWADKWWRASKTESYFYSRGFIGPSETNDIIVEFSELERNQGYQLTFGQIRDLTGSGVTGDSTMEGQEEVPATYDDAITLDQKRNAIRTKGKLSEQYPSDKRVRMWARDLLYQWMADTIDQDQFTALGTSPTKVLYGGDATSTATIEAGDYFTTNLLGKFKAYAKKATPKIIGKQIKGKRYLVVVVSPDQDFDCVTRDSAWSQAMREAANRGPDNPIFKYSDWVFNNVLVHTHERVALATTWGSGSNLNGATALGMGVACGGIAYAKRKIWNEKTFDYGNKVGFCIGVIKGETKAVFNSSDNALVAIRTYRTSN